MSDVSFQCTLLLKQQDVSFQTLPLDWTVKAYIFNQKVTFTNGLLVNWSILSQIAKGGSFDANIKHWQQCTANNESIACDLKQTYFALYKMVWPRR